MKKDDQIARKIESKSKKNNENVEFTIKFNKKKALQRIGIILVVVAVLGLAFAVSKKSESRPTTSFEFVDINIDQYLEKMNSEEKSIIYIARPGCSWCQKESPIVKKIGGASVFSCQPRQEAESRLKS